MPCQSSSFHDFCMFLTYITCTSVDEILLSYTNGLVHTFLDEYLYMNKFSHPLNHPLSFPYWVFLAVDIFFKTKLLEPQISCFWNLPHFCLQELWITCSFSFFLKVRSEKWKDFLRPSVAISLFHSIDINTWTHKDTWSLPLSYSSSRSHSQVSV